MRRLIYTQMVSVDGYIDPGESYSGQDWAFSSEALVRHFIEFENRIDIHLYGRQIFEILADWWSKVDQNQSSPDYMIEYGRIWRAKEKIVFSQTLDGVGWNSRLIRGDVGEEIAKLKAEPGRDMALYGSLLASSVIPLGLIDEYWLYVNPVVFGAGKPMFLLGEDILRLRLIETQEFDCDVVLLRYAEGRSTA
jgi:dihydrofolate reductase